MFYLFADSEHESDAEPQAEPDLDPLQLAENRARQFIESKKNQNSRSGENSALKRFKTWLNDAYGQANMDILKLTPKALSVYLF